jgi:hypothetical protein
MFGRTVVFQHTDLSFSNWNSRDIIIGKGDEKTLTV